jgi:hypothetical protein
MILYRRWPFSGHYNKVVSSETGIFSSLENGMKGVKENGGRSKWYQWSDGK